MTNFTKTGRIPLPRSGNGNRKGAQVGTDDGAEFLLLVASIAPWRYGPMPADAWLYSVTVNMALLALCLRPSCMTKTFA